MPHHKLQNLQGNKFGELLVESLVPKTQSKQTRAEWVCLCVCGQRKVFRADILTSGKAKSCGCVTSESRRQNMKQVRARYSPACVLPLWETYGLNCETSNAEKRAYGFEYRLWFKYGLTVPDYFDIAVRQNFACAICLQSLQMDRNTHIDHDHVTGKIRGLLCASCNTALGHFADNQTNLERAIVYLRQDE